MLHMGSGNERKTKIYFDPFKVEINFSLQLRKKCKKSIDIYEIR